MGIYHAYLRGRAVMNDFLEGRQKWAVKITTLALLKLSGCPHESPKRGCGWAGPVGTAIHRNAGGGNRTANETSEMSDHVF